MKAPISAALGALFLFGGAPARAQDDAVSARSCCLQLLAPTGARAFALGDAIGALGGPGSIYANPATVAGLADDQFVVHTFTNEVARTHTFSLLIPSDVIGTIGVTYKLIDQGEIQNTDSQGNVLGVIDLLEHVLTATYATAIGAGLDAGLSYNLYQQRFDCRGFCTAESIAATTHMVDAGLRYRPTFAQRLELGAAILHFGFPLQVKNAPQAAPTPAQLRLSAAHEVLQYVRPDSAIQLRLSADLLTPVREPGESFVNLGAEISVEDRIFLWMGYGGGVGPFVGGPALGVGLELDRFSVGVARSFSSTDGSEPFQVSFGVRF